MVHWLVTGAVLLVALVALARARSLGRRLDRLTKGYWELRHRNGELEARVRRLDSEPGPGVEMEPPPAGTFIPLSALKR